MTRPDPFSPLKTARSMVSTAMPIGAFYLTELLVGLTDLAVVGALGATELAAVGLAKTILLSLIVIGFAVLSIGTVLMAERPNRQRRALAFAASTRIAIAFCAFGILVAHGGWGLLDTLGYDQEVVAPFHSYATVLAWAVAPALVFAALKNVLTVLQRTAVIAPISIGIVLGNLVASVGLVHGVGTVPGLGVAGAAWATLLVNALAAGVLYGIVRRAGHLRVGRVRRAALAALAGRILSLGWAAGAQQALESALFVVVLLLLGLHSTLWLAAGTVVFAVMELNYAASGALGETLSARLAAARRDAARVRIGLLRVASALAVAAAGSLALMAGLFAETTVSVFASAVPSESARALMVDLLRWTAPIFVFDALQVLFIHALRGLRRTLLPMVLSTLCYWGLGLGGGYVLAEGAGFGAPGIWIGFSAGLVCAAGLLGVMAYRSAR